MPNTVAVAFTEVAFTQFIKARDSCLSLYLLTRTIKLPRFIKFLIFGQRRLMFTTGADIR